MPRPHRWLVAFALVVCPSLVGCSAPPGRRGVCCPCDPAASRPDDPWAAAARVHGRGSAAVWSFLAATYDRDRDGRVTSSEHPRGKVVVGRLDRDGDGDLSAADFADATMMANYIVALTMERIAADPPARTGDGTGSPAPRDSEVPGVEVLTRAFTRADRDRSGALDEREVDTALATATATPVPDVLDLPAGVRPFPFFLEAADTDRSATLTLPETLAWQRAMVAREAEGRAAAAKVAPSAPPAAAPAAAGPASAAPAATPPPAGRRPSAPAVGALAPDFTLRSRGGTTTRTLSDFRGTPVVLVFGSYTCPPFRASAGWIRAAYDRHHADARFLFVYVREAHAIDGRAPMPDVDQPIVEEPTTFEHRRAVANACALDLRFGVFETLVDDLDDGVARAYAAPPARLFVIARDGTVAYRSEPGPFGLRQAEFEAAVRAAVAPPAP